ncbi:MAG: Lrp/AsnC family transcriptional regulator [Candidatus Aenigmarchaeota archaeon]|nr:Lrp/AsnC family transcriptional regulator [Candidatus Aenigmarchaeota archaeon]
MKVQNRVESGILKELQKDSRRSLRTLSRALGASITTVSRKIDEMEKEGIIRNYSAILDHEKLGYEMTAITEIFASKGKLVEAEKDISRKRGVLAVYDVTGRADAIVISRFKKRSDLNGFVKSLLALPSIERTETHVVLNVIKEDFRIDF